MWAAPRSQPSSSGQGSALAPGSAADTPVVLGRPTEDSPQDAPAETDLLVPFSDLANRVVLVVDTGAGAVHRTKEAAQDAVLVRDNDSEEVRKLKGTRLRKGLRICMIILRLAVGAFLIGYVISRSASSTKVSVPLDERLVFNLQECRFRVEVVNPDSTEYEVPAEGQGLVWYEAYLPWVAVGSGFDWSQSEVTFTSEEDLEVRRLNAWQRRSSKRPRHGRRRPRPLPRRLQTGGGKQFTLKNTGAAELEACMVHLRVRSQARLAALEVGCTDNCTIDTFLRDVDASWVWKQWQVNELIVYNMAYDVASDNYKSGVSLANLQATQLFIYYGAADVFLEDVAVIDASYVEVSGGDLYAQLRRDVLVEWTDSTAFYCVAGQLPVQLTTNGHCNETWEYEASGSSNTTTRVRASTCTAQGKLCGYKGCSSTTPALEVYVPDGSYYITRYSPEVVFDEIVSAIRNGTSMGQIPTQQLHTSVGGGLQRDEQLRPQVGAILAGVGASIG